MKYIRELDSIRGIGIIIVVLFHWIPVDSFYNTFPNRPFGVDVFFVLSGFLITQILLSARRKGEAEGFSKMHIFLNFFFRRALRIFPVYYLVIILILSTHQWLDASVRSEIVPSLTYTLNFHFHQQQYWGDLTTHLWTLSIEEQFYLFWPWIILLVPQRYLSYTIILFIVVGSTSQMLISDMEFGYLPTNTCLDAFGIGAMIAWILVFRPSDLGKCYKLVRIAGVSSALILAVGAAIPDVIFLAPQRTLRSLVAAWAITYVIYKSQITDGKALPVFSNPILIFIGKISYGMYLYHIFFPWMYYLINDPVNRMLPSILEPYLMLLTLLENFALLIVVSWLSYRFIERPILKFKHMIYPGKKMRPIAAAHPPEQHIRI